MKPLKKAIKHTKKQNPVNVQMLTALLNLQDLFEFFIPAVSSNNHTRLLREGPGIWVQHEKPFPYSDFLTGF